MIQTLTQNFTRSCQKTILMVVFLEIRKWSTSEALLSIPTKNMLKTTLYLIIHQAAHNLIVSGTNNTGFHS